MGKQLRKAIALVAVGGMAFGLIPCCPCNFNPCTVVTDVFTTLATDALTDAVNDVFYPVEEAEE